MAGGSILCAKAIPYRSHRQSDHLRMYIFDDKWYNAKVFFIYLFTKHNLNNLFKQLIVTLSLFGSFEGKTVDTQSIHTYKCLNVIALYNKILDYGLFFCYVSVIVNPHQHV